MFIINMSVELPWLKPGAKPVPKKVWGPRGWQWAHSEAINYPAAPTPRQQQAAHLRFWAFIQGLPCGECRYHATEYARVYPPDFSGTHNYQTWMWRFHNAVNRRLGKPLISAEEYRELYKEEMAKTYWQYV